MATGRRRTIALLLGTATTIITHTTAAERAADEIKELPGWAGPLPSRQFSGMVNASEWSGQMHQQHYWLVESESDPANDPLLVWQLLRGTITPSKSFVLLVFFWGGYDTLIYALTGIRVGREFSQQSAVLRVNSAIF